MIVDKKQDNAFVRFVPDERIEKTPPLPPGRPPTRREVWMREHAIYFDFKGHAKTPICTERCNHRNPGELERFCRDEWAGIYVAAVNAGWKKHPEWVEGQPVIPEAVPDELFPSGDWNSSLKRVYELHEIVVKRTEVAA